MISRRAALAAPFARRFRRVRILAALQQVMGPLPPLPSAPPAVKTLDESTLDGFRRRKILYEAEPGDWVPAWLLLPLANTPAPAAICLHQTTRAGKDEPAGVSGLPNLHYAAELARRGFVSIAPDYPNFGEYPLDPYARGYQSATMKGIFNHIRAAHLLAALPNAGPIAAIGHSLGGHNALFLAAFHPRIRAVVSSCGFTPWRYYYGGDLTGWTHKGYMPRIASVYKKSPALLPFDFPDILQAISPRPIFVNAPLHDANFDVTGVKACLEQLNSPSIQAVHPDCAHDFPPEIRHQAYAFLQHALRP